MKNYIQYLTIGALLMGSLTSCNDFLDREPLDKVTPEKFFSAEADLAAYAINNYKFVTVDDKYGINLFGKDNDTDNQASGTSNSFWIPGEKKVAADRGEWKWEDIRSCNYFFDQVLPRYEEGAITGNQDNVKHYIGEMYFLRAYQYFNKLVSLGDFPIVTEVLPDETEVLKEESKRQPRNKVARFIIEDLDRAIELMSLTTDNGKNRLTKNVALLFKSRVALFEATWLKYHKGTDRVPGGPGWPGAQQEYNAGFSIDIDKEVDWFLEQAMDASAQVADRISLTKNTGIYNPDSNPYNWNPYFEMFSQPSLKDVPEVLLWKEYNFDLGIKHNAIYRSRIGARSGYTRPFIESFLMKDGLPIYATGGQYQYKGDKTIDDVKTDRDLRLQLFVWGESTLVFSDPDAGEEQVGDTFDFPNLISLEAQTRMISGYQSRKFYAYDYSQGKSDEQQGTNACPAFRVAEGMLNYLEACYEKNGRLDATAESYWRKIRQRAGVSDDFEKTIAATDLNKESDFGVYSGTQQVDKTLYNIRRERMQELFSEGFRFADLIRWRSFDRLITTKWVPEGVNFWDEMYTHFKTDPNDKDDPRDLLIADGSANANMSMKEMSKYVRPYSINTLETNELLNGYTWREAYYLYPLGITDIRTGSADRDLNNSNLYQNLYWPIQAGGRAEK